MNAWSENFIALSGPSKGALFSGLGACLLSACAQVDDGRGHPNLLVITLDQPDDLPLSDFEAEDGLHFQHVWHPNGSSASALASLLTGLHPEHHGILSLGDELDASIATLAQRVYEQDVWTGAAVALGPGQPSAGLKQGFERFTAVAPNAPGKVLQTASQWMTERTARGGGWMIWTHLGASQGAEPGPQSPLRALMDHARELDSQNRTLIVVINLATTRHGPVSQGWARAFLPRAVAGESQADLSYGDFTLLFIEHLSEPLWPLSASQPKGLDGISPGLALFGLAARRGPLVFELTPEEEQDHAIALFAGWSMTREGTLRPMELSDTPAPQRVQTLLKEALGAQ